MRLPSKRLRQESSAHQAVTGDSIPMVEIIIIPAAKEKARSHRHLCLSAGNHPQNSPVCQGVVEFVASPSVPIRG